jgi:hypothetical protein
MSLTFIKIMAKVHLMKKHQKCLNVHMIKASEVHKRTPMSN